MSDMVERYNKSQAPRPVEAKQIPALATNFFDQLDMFQDGFTPNEREGDETKFTKNALDFYATEVKTMKIPNSFIPNEQGAVLNQWGPDKHYYTPGQK